MFNSNKRNLQKKDTTRKIIIAKNVEVIDLMDSKVLNFALKTSIGKSFPSEGISSIALLYNKKGNKGVFFNIKGIKINNFEELIKFIHKQLETNNHVYDTISIRYK